jgi:hypothetical protein
MHKSSFSGKLSDWLKTPGSKTFGDLENLFQEKSFAVTILILMAPAALPLPTAGVTHVFEIITSVLAVEMIFGRKTIWSPKFWRRRNLGGGLEKKALPKFIKIVGWLEKRSKKRLDNWLRNDWFIRLAGLFILVFTIASAVALPFSGLDTLPALAVVLISLSLILEDALILPVAFAVGAFGIFLEILLGAAAWHTLFHIHLF